MSIVGSKDIFGDDGRVPQENGYGPYAGVVASHVKALIEGRVSVPVPENYLTVITNMLYIVHESFEREGFPRMRREASGADLVKKLDLRAAVLRAYEGAGHGRPEMLFEDERRVRDMIYLSEGLSGMSSITESFRPACEIFADVLKKIADEDDRAYNIRTGPGMTCRTLGE
jgi:hypothetical protein